MAESSSRLGAAKYRATLMSEQACCSRVRVFTWNELLHDSDSGDDLLVFLINNRFVINNFPSKSEIPDSYIRDRLRDLLDFYGFINKFYHGKKEEGTLSSVLKWKDLFKFDRKSVSSHDFGYRILKELHDGVFLDDTLVPLGRQISAKLNSRFPSFDDYITSVTNNNKDEPTAQNSRIVLMVEIFRTRTIQVDLDIPLLTLIQQGYVDPYQVSQGISVDPLLLYNTLDSCLPHNPFDKVPPAAYHYSRFTRFRNEKDSIFDPHYHSFVTALDSIDGFSLQKDEDDYLSILAFMRASLYQLNWKQLKENERQKISKFLRDRKEGSLNATYPYKLMCPNKAAGFTTIEPPLGWPIYEEAPVCAICLDKAYLDDKLAETLCFHIFHAACLTPWISRTPSCPLCRFPQW